LRVEIITNVIKDVLKKSETVEIPERNTITLDGLFNHLIDLYGQQISKRLLSEDNLRPEIIFLINGKSVKKSSGLSSKLKDGDRLSILTAMAGG
jgi:molybdopterin converting factor small subunit